MLVYWRVNTQSSNVLLPPYQKQHQQLTPPIHPQKPDLTFNLEQIYTTGGRVTGATHHLPVYPTQPWLTDQPNPNL